MDACKEWAVCLLNENRPFKKRKIKVRIINLSISKRLSGGFGILLLLMLAVGALGLNGMNTLYNKMNEIVLFNNSKMEAAGAMYDALAQHEIGFLNLLLATTDEDKEAAKGQIEWQLGQYEDAKNSVAELFTLAKVKPSETEIFSKIEGDAAAVTPLFAKAIDLSDNYRIADALKVLREEIKPLMRNWTADVTELGVVERRLNDSAIADAEKVHDWARNLTVGIAALALLLGISIAFFITRGILRPLKKAVEAADAVANGDLTQDIEVTSKDETGKLLQGLKDMNEKLAGIVSGVRSTTEAINTAAQEVAAGNSDLSQRTEEQASSLEETASSMEELTSTVRQNTENAKQANQLAANASDVAVKGGQVVGEVVQTMASISASSKKIVDIISVIEGIAFQTNILALNAAVEAARAGEQGRGFAVVASEVRNLAQRSAAAAKEIKDLIGDSVGKVDAGSKQVDQAGATMEEIVNAVKRVTDIMSEIAAASNEQSAGIEQVNKAITQMDEVTQQNAALVEEASASAESMRQQANGLYAAVSVFKLTKTKARAQGEDANPEIAPSAKASPVSLGKQRRLVKAKETKDGEWKEF
jgi:methyl-accepting chemotaxis protein